jgi:predicted 3-demethylubiquinone-9 3-methyltransferase (glyoxalase superfamily)
MEDFSVDRLEFQVIDESLRAEAMFKEAVSVVVATNNVL